MWSKCCSICAAVGYREAAGSWVAWQGAGRTKYCSEMLLKNIKQEECLVGGEEEEGKAEELFYLKIQNN